MMDALHLFMTLDAAIAAMFLIVAAWGWKRRPDRTAGTLLAVVIVQIALGQTIPRELLVGSLAMTDGAVMVAMAEYYWRWRSQRARMVGFIAFLHCALNVIEAGGLLPIGWTAYAVTMNALQFLQLMVAGGWADDLVRFVDRIDPGAVAGRGQHGHSSGAS